MASAYQVAVGEASTLIMRLYTFRVYEAFVASMPVMCIASCTVRILMSNVYVRFVVVGGNFVSAVRDADSESAGRVDAHTMQTEAVRR